MGQKGTKPLSPEKLAEESPDSSVVIWEMTGSCGVLSSGLVSPLCAGGLMETFAVLDGGVNGDVSFEDSSLTASPLPFTCGSCCGESAVGGVSGDVLVIPLLPGCEVSVLVSGSVDAAPASIGGSSPPGAVFIIFL